MSEPTEEAMQAAAEVFNLSDEYLGGKLRKTIPVSMIVKYIYESATIIDNETYAQESLAICKRLVDWFNNENRVVIQNLVADARKVIAKAEGKEKENV